MLARLRQTAKAVGARSVRSADVGPTPSVNARYAASHQFIAAVGPRTDVHGLQPSSTATGAEAQPDRMSHSMWCVMFTRARSRCRAGSFQSGTKKKGAGALESVMLGLLDTLVFGLRASELAVSMDER